MSVNSKGVKIKRTNGYASISVDMDDTETRRSVIEKHRELVNFFKDMKERYHNECQKNTKERDT